MKCLVYLFLGAERNHSSNCLFFLFLGTERNESSNWPRLVENPFTKGKSVTCRLCTSRGKLEEILMTKSRDGNKIVQYCKSKQLGQQLKLNLTDKSQPTLDPQLEHILDDPDHN